MINKINIEVKEAIHYSSFDFNNGFFLEICCGNQAEQIDSFSNFYQQCFLWLDF